ncbi:hypothetical protein MTQ01_13750 [Streptomyces sp. XM4193]|uniref:hypothetical protein n=1 Tax=Streptomyces sp. XM4193 TaxID=2929782 RepID=UPI001FF9BFB3|nr:hypothetical protein [Streptomyces sp. XM4193]MCK1797062.1 hypothetical protein [Streptomyces sp. XM4193]
MADTSGRRPASTATPHHRRLRAAAVAVAVGAPLLLGGAPAGAVTTADASPRTSDAHCVQDLGSGGLECYATFTDAVDAATGGRISDAPAGVEAAEGDARLHGRTAELARDRDAIRAGEVIQGTFFDETNYGGGSLTVRGEAPCKKDGWVDWQLTLDDEWKDRISSVQPWAECWIWLYPEPDLGGERDGPFKENTPDIGSFMNDRTQSIGFS